MEFIKTSRLNLIEYSYYLENKLKNHFYDIYELDILIKPLKTAIMIIQNYNSFDLNQILQDILNDIYLVLRKFNSSIESYIESSTFLKENALKTLKEASNRHQIYLYELYYLELVSNNKPQIKDHLFNLSLTFYRNIPNTIENIFVNIIQFKDEVFYIKTNDIFEFIYLYRSNEGIWYWSPPKKTDPEDIWIKCPQIKIEKGYWIDKKLFGVISDFIIWLDIFKPSLTHQK